MRKTLTKLRSRDHRESKRGEGTVSETDARAPGSAVQAVAIGGALLKFVAAAGRPLALREIAAASNMTPSRAHKYLAGLMRSGLIDHDPDTGRYDLGTTVLELGLSALARLDYVRIASDELRDLSDRTGLVTTLVVWGSNGPTVIRWQPGRLGLSVRVNEGRNLSLLHSSAGRIFLTYMPTEEIEPVLHHELTTWNAAAPDRRISMDDIADLRAEVRAEGAARSIGEQNPGVQAISAPVFDHEGKLRACITFLGIIGSFDTSAENPTILALKTSATKLSKRLGYGIRMAGK